MMVNIERGALEDIVKDGVKEMMSQIGDRNSKRRVWVMAAKKAVKEYQQKVQELFLPVLVQDFSTKLVIQFRKGKMSDEDVEKVKAFMKMVEESNIKNLIDELLKKIDELVKAQEADELKKKLEEVRRVVVDGHNWIFRRIELHVRNVVSDAVYKKSVERSKMEVMLYNFVDGDVPDCVKDLFKNGMDSVPSCKLSRKDIDSRVEEALLEFLMRLGRRRFYGYERVVHVSSVENWILKVKSMQLGHEVDKFIEDLENSLPGLKVELELVYSDVEIDTKEQLMKNLEQRDWVLVMCDKNMGMSLFSYILAA